MIADTFVPTVDIRSQGRRKGRGKVCKGPREEGMRSAREGGRKWDRTGRPRSKTETGTRTKAVRRTTAVQAHAGGDRNTGNR